MSSLTLLISNVLASLEGHPYSTLCIPFHTAQDPPEILNALMPTLQYDHFLRYNYAFPSYSQELSQYHAQPKAFLLILIVSFYYLNLSKIDISNLLSRPF